jgi:DNA-binding NarL/FixJ family response regulator
MNILLVDPHALFREGLANLLSSQPGFTVVGQTGDASEAVRQTVALKPHVVLMDLSLGNGSGPAVTRAILAQLPETVIIFLAAREDDETQFDVFCAGARGCLTRHVPVSKMMSTLRAAQRGEVFVPPAVAMRMVTEFARRSPHDTPAFQRLAELTPGELDVLHGLAEGRAFSDIAAALDESESTVKARARGVLAKLQRRYRADAAADDGL